MASFHWRGSCCIFRRQFSGWATLTSSSFVSSTPLASGSPWPSSSFSTFFLFAAGPDLHSLGDALDSVVAYEQFYFLISWCCTVVSSLSFLRVKLLLACIWCYTHYWSVALCWCVRKRLSWGGWTENRGWREATELFSCSLIGSNRDVSAFLWLFTLSPLSKHQHLSRNCFFLILPSSLGVWPAIPVKTN